MDQIGVKGRSGRKVSRREKKEQKKENGKRPTELNGVPNLLASSAGKVSRMCCD